MLLLVIAGLTALAVPTYASTKGTYFGGQLGWGDLDQGGFAKSDVASNLNINSKFSSSFKDSGLAGRLYGGYLFNPYFGLEGGYTRFRDGIANTSTISPTLGIEAEKTIKTYAVDIMGKGVIPLKHGFNIYGKLGAAHLREKTTTRGTITRGGLPAMSTSALETTSSRIYPTFGAGVGYNINKNLVADVSWTRIQAGENRKPPSTNFVGFGLTLSFG